MEELRQARLDYDRTNPLGTIEQPSNNQPRCLRGIPTNIMAALRNQPLEIRFTEATITRVCLRLGVSPRQTLRATRTLR